MNDHHPNQTFSRRTLLASATAGLAFSMSSSLRAAAPEPGHHPAATLSPDQALARLKEGNRAYLEARPVTPDTGGKRRLEIAQSQSPIAIVLCCSDSRVPPEFIFRQDKGELFVIRNAGNTVDTAAMGSLEYAVAELKVPLVVVLGHERCGAVGAAVAVVEKGATFPGSIGRMVEPIIPAVLDARRAGAADLLDSSVRANVIRTVNRLRQFSEPIVLDPIKAGKLKIIGARYDLVDGNVEFFSDA